MESITRKRVIAIGLLLGVVSVCVAQRGRGGRGWGRGPQTIEEGRLAAGIEKWPVKEGFLHDTFTFARVEYSSGWGGNGWRTDFPDSDLNFSLRLQQLTSLKVNPDPVVVKLSDEELFNYPFVYMIEPGGIHLFPEEVAGLRRYCLNGGFMMVDDFWGDREYNVFYHQIKRAFPDREVEELPITHEIFHNVYDLDEKPQIPSIGWMYDGNTWEVRKGPSAREVHFRAIKDDDGRIMVLICHNTDLGDGWEREGSNREYFEKFSVKKAYPMGINIVTYAMTH